MSSGLFVVTVLLWKAKGPCFCFRLENHSRAPSIPAIVFFSWTLRVSSFDCQGRGNWTPPTSRPTPARAELAQSIGPLAMGRAMGVFFHETSRAVGLGLFEKKKICLGLFGSVCVCLGLFWVCLGLFGSVWVCFGFLGLFWVCLGLSVWVLGVFGSVLGLFWKPKFNHPCFFFNLSASSRFWDPTQTPQANKAE